MPGTMPEVAVRAAYKAEGPLHDATGLLLFRILNQYLRFWERGQRYGYRFCVTKFVIWR